jgi:chromosome segregation ATPase
MTMQPSSPFFTNDWAGLLKIVSMLAVAVASVIGAIWKMMRGPLQDADKELQRQILKLEEDVKARQNAEDRHNHEIDQLRRGVESQEREFKYLRDSYVRIEADVRSLSEHSQVNKTEIIAVFEQKTESLRIAMHTVDRGVAALEATIKERDRLTEQFDRWLSARAASGRE